jgi:hypothetical protein
LINPEKHKSSKHDATPKSNAYIACRGSSISKKNDVADDPTFEGFQLRKTDEEKKNFPPIVTSVPTYMNINMARK